MAQTYTIGLNTLIIRGIKRVCLKIITPPTYTLFPISYIFNIR